MFGTLGMGERLQPTDSPNPLDATARATNHRGKAVTDVKRYKPSDIADSILAGEVIGTDQFVPAAAYDALEQRHSEHLEAWRVNSRASADRVAELEAAGRAVVTRWDTPLWVDAGPTADVINALRKVIGCGDQ